MFDRRFNAVAIAITLWSAGAAAETGVLVLGDPSFCNFDPLPPCSGDVCPTGQECQTSGGQNVCVPVGAILCCTGQADDCEEGTTCQAVSGFAEPTSLCLDDGFCGSATQEQVRLCYATPGTPTRTTSFEAGDCDGDGLTNGTELDLETNPCVGPPSIGAVGTDGCIGLTGCNPAQLSGCMAPGMPASTCTATPDGTGTYCEPADADILFCCGGSFVCPNAGDACATTPEGQFCVGHCIGAPGIDPANCILAEGGTAEYPEGDCDLDGTPNGMDEAPCTVDVVGVDAGPIPDFDGGTEPPPIEPTFSGGGGCACRATPARGAAPGIFALAIVALLWRSRR